jgi:Protein of unknown function (DUF1553)
MVTSSTYRQRSAPAAPGAAADPENRLLGRMSPRRLDAEALRDAVLQAAGTLNIEMGGPPVRVPLEPEVYATIFTEGEPDNLWPVTPDPRQHARRTLYLLHKRNVRLPMLAVFDQPDMLSPCGARGESVHALQALTLMNSDFMQGQSRALAARVLGGGVQAFRRPDTPASSAEANPTRSRINQLFLLTLGRPPREVEARAAERFLEEETKLLRARQAGSVSGQAVWNNPEGPDPAEETAWLDLCLAQLNLNEFVYLR